MTSVNSSIDVSLQSNSYLAKCVSKLPIENGLQSILKNHKGETRRTMYSKTADNDNTSVIAEIDFSKYRSRELTDKILSLVSIPHSARFLAVTIFVCVVLAEITIYVALNFNDQNFFSFALSEAYGFFASVVFSIAIWLVLMIRMSLKTLTAIIAILLETTSKIVVDYRSITKGEKNFPPIADLIAAVYENVFMHIFRNVVENTAGFLGRPVLWVYSLTIDRMFRKVVRLAFQQRITKEKTNEVTDAIKSGMQVIEAEESAITERLNWASNKVTNSGNWLSNRVMLPCYLIISAFFIVLIMPIIILIWLT